MEIKIHTETIELAQAIKRADWAQSGGEAKWLVQQGEVTVNGEVDTRRGRKLRPGDRVAFDGNELIIT